MKGIYMNELTVFKNDSFGEIRTIVIDDEPWFVLKDICASFGETNYRRVAGRLEEDEKGVSQIATPGGKQQMTIINESGLYSALFVMQPEKARGVSNEYIEQRQKQLKDFKRWVTHDILPSIRKTGGYIAGQESLSDAELMAKALLVAQRTIDERNKQIEVMKPKALFADAVSASETSILIGDLAKLLKQNGVDIGQNRLFRWLRDEKYLMKSGESRNMPTQRAMDLGLFEIKETPRTLPSGAIHVDRTPKVTGKGQTYFVNKFLKEN